MLSISIMHWLSVDNLKSALSATFFNIGIRNKSADNLIDPDSIVFIKSRPEIYQTSAFEVSILSNSYGI